MRILLIVSSFNSLSQFVFAKLNDAKHKVSVQLVINDQDILNSTDKFQPNIILAPYLEKFIPKKIFTKIPTFIFHPGIVGDKGKYSLDNAILDNIESWGVCILRANNFYDEGDIYSKKTFKMRKASKSNLYRNEIKNSFNNALDDLFNNLNNKNFKPEKQYSSQAHNIINQKKRKIDWDNDNSETIIKKINCSDGSPGVKDNILGIDCYIFNVFKEDKLKGKPKKIISKRDGAICIGTIDKAIWIGHLKKKNSFKLPATYVLKDKLTQIKENRIPLIFNRSYNTFYEISCSEKNNIAYLYFNFYNGAMNTNQCIRLKYAFEYLKKNNDVVVFMGGKDFFSNGIDLNILEDSTKVGEDGWSNINAINDLIKSIIFSDIITISSLEKNAAAGGLFLALACDYVVASETSVLNPHYKTMGLSGSEYHSYNLKKRVGLKKAKSLLNNCLPISAKYAKKISMIDKMYGTDNYFYNLTSFCENICIEDELNKKYIYLKDNKDKINEYKEKELKKMYNEFWDKNSIFHKLRYNFVYNIPNNKHFIEGPLKE